MKRITLISFITLLLGCAGFAACAPGEAVRERNVETVKTFLRLLEEEKIGDYLELYADNGKQVNPYGSGIVPPEVSGKAALREFWEPVPGRFDGMEFPIKAIHPMQDPNKVLVHFDGRIKLKGDAGFYNNEYFALFTFNEDGKILEYVEIFNPLTIVRAFGLKDQI